MKRVIGLVMGLCFDEFFYINLAPDLDKLINAFIFGHDFREDIAAREYFTYWCGIADHLGCVMQGLAFRARLHWSHAFAWLLWIVEDALPIARR